ncbi:hypothetical protein N7456_007162 [Penicillium angulare]|uniref:Zn(2)-C6 fungal-type domain-containing protein n=1 Tax=Penicillium angulare TaxID=116970 RepID=A0A9W9FJ60_9EURO|nr:hypothetical protein N7456_007162 [Penicillium angulare]
MSNDPNRQGQYPPPWNGQSEDHGAYQFNEYKLTYLFFAFKYPPSSYPPPPEHDRAYYPPPPPSSQYPPPPPHNMAAIHHQMPVPGQDPYHRLPPPPAGYPPRPDMYGQPPPGNGVYQAAAPRQRTAIACRYCRRRKIRCSGFESSTDGRCTNCVRFNQECMFTPVSSQAQAFVPAHAAYPHLRNQGAGRTSGVTLYGAHGQPLPPQHQPQGPETTLPPPQGMYQQYPYGGPPLASSSTDPRQSVGAMSDYPDPTNLAPVSSSAPGYPSPSPYYPPPLPQDRRTSPQSAYAVEARHSSSPHGSPYPPMQQQHQPPPPQGGPTPPPTSTPGGSGRAGLNVRDMLNPGDSNGNGRSSTDSDMLNALNRRGLGQ